MTNRIFFFHMPKAGGTSVTAALARRFHPDRIAPNIENDVQGHELNGGRYRQFGGYDFYSGHYGVDIFDSVADGHLLMSNFRHPVARVHSLYRFFREVEVSAADLAQRHYAAVRTAKTSTFAEFVTSRDEIVSTYVSNQQARQLTGSPWARPAQVDLAAAASRIDAMAWFYVCEQPRRSLDWLDGVLGIEDIPVLNVTAAPGISAEAEAIADTILERNQLDLALYEHAAGILQSRTK